MKVEDLIKIKPFEYERAKQMVLGEIDSNVLNLYLHSFIESCIIQLGHKSESRIREFTINQQLKKNVLTCKLSDDRIPKQIQDKVNEFLKSLCKELSKPRPPSKEVKKVEKPKVSIKDI